MATTVSAQAPLDLRILSERIENLEQRLSQMSSGGAPLSSSANSAVGEDGQPLPTDAVSRLQVRLLQLERLVENLTGQVEQSRFEVSRLRSQLDQMSNDVSYRLAVLEQATGVSSAVASLPQNTSVQQRPSSPPLATAANPSPAGVGEVSPSLQNPTMFEPNADMPMSQPVQPQPQMQTQTPEGPVSAGQTAPSMPPQTPANSFGVLTTDEEGRPLPPSPEAVAAAEARAAQPPQPEPFDPPPSLATAPSEPVSADRIGMAQSSTTDLVALPEGSAQTQYDYAFGLLRQADYSRAERALRLFLEEHPNEELSGNAQYWLGETYYVRGDFEQAAVEFLSGYQTYPRSNKGPDNLLKLGLSMGKLGQTDGACTALSRLATEYPEANDTIRRRAQTERANLKCS